MSRDETPFEVVASAEYDAQADEIRDCAASPWVEIVDVVPAAVKIRAHELEEGDFLFDGYGGTHEVVSVRKVGKNKRWVDSERDDGWEDRFGRDDIITVIRKTRED